VSSYVAITLDTRPPTVFFGVPQNFGGTLVGPYEVDETPNLFTATLEVVPGGLLVPVTTNSVAGTMTATAPAGANALKLTVRTMDDVLNEGIFTLDFATSHYVLIAHINVYVRLLGRMVIATKLGNEFAIYAKLFSKAVLQSKLGIEMKVRKILGGRFKIGDDD
jgi:hypothetical protein